MNPCGKCQKEHRQTLARTPCNECSLAKNRTFYFILTNCDCASFSKMLSNHPSRNRIGIKCPCCEKLLGPMQYGPIVSLRARNYQHAMAIAHNY